MHTANLHRPDHSSILSEPFKYIPELTISASKDIASSVPRPFISAIIPCLNEEMTLAICINKIMAAFNRRGIQGEVIVGDNGSTGLC
ncbi:glycosyltransferase [Kluyvera ascorbata]|uniref:glycosyltransferase n=1 Tax=Kluyvera ascorbata TaxID=51288 RepID=UPI0029018A2C|nr:glycosyltransferase [Kluyvera ascorbata]MDU1199070.1 glycosyltransferase [Kluyvera ascorbata]